MGWGCLTRILGSPGGWRDCDLSGTLWRVRWVGPWRKQEGEVGVLAGACPWLFQDSHIPGPMPARGWPPVSVSRLSGSWFTSPRPALKGRFICEKAALAC